MTTSRFCGLASCLTASICSAGGLLCNDAHIETSGRVFCTTSLGAREWLVMLPFLFLPAIAVELTKIPFRRQKERELTAQAA